METESSDVSDAEKDKMYRRKDSLNLQQLPEKTQELQSNLISTTQRRTTWLRLDIPIPN